jgi:hypothetical protein
MMQLAHFLFLKENSVWSQMTDPALRRKSYKKGGDGPHLKEQEHSTLYQRSDFKPGASDVGFYV